MRRLAMASKTRTFFLNAISLTLTALFMRGVGMLFNVIVSNRAGSEAMGLYSMLGSVYGLAITLAAAGINLGTTRLVSDAIGEGRYDLAKRSAKVALLCCSITGALATALLFVTAPLLGTHLIGDERATVPLRILSTSLIPIAICSCLSGYFTAVRRVKLNASAQAMTQLFRIGATVIFLGLIGSNSAERACIALVIGACLTEVLSLIISYSLYAFDRKKLKSGSILPYDNRSGITKKLLGITLPVTFSAFIRSSLNMLQHVLIPKGLLKSGKSWAQALSSYGSLHGMAMPLILFPSAFISAFAGLLIPEISECIVQNNRDRLERVSYRALTLSLIFSIGVSGIMIFFSKELGNLVYKSAETAHYIRIMAPLIPIMYIDGTVDAILKGSGHQVYSMNVNIADALTACLFAIFLIPKIGILGYIISIYATEILNTTLSLAKMISVSKMKIRLLHQIILPILCIIGATNLAHLLLLLMPLPIENTIGLTVAIALTVAIYIILLLLTRTIGKDEWEFLNASFMSERKYAKRFKEPSLE